MKQPASHHLETISVVVPEAAVSAYASALQAACDSVGFFRLDDGATWQVEGVKPRGEGEAELQASLALAGAATGIAAAPQRRDTDADGWLARVYASLPEQLIGRRFAVRGTHLTGPPAPGRLTLTLDAGLAFGSGEHGSTRGCLRALERVAARRPRRIADIGTGSGILALAAARLLRRPVLGVDLEEWSVRTARENAARNRLGPHLRFVRGDGWFAPAIRAKAPYDLVFANILARPLCQMARRLAPRLRPRATVILSGLLDSQERMVLAAHRAQGLRLDCRVREGRWTTLVVRGR
jgi:ribosomal protein L11 methyltransferase